MKAKRIGIAIIRNKYGIKSEYCQYLISQVNNLVDKLMLIDDLSVYGKVGNVCIAQQYINETLQETIGDYSELIVFDDSVYGPLYPLNDIFQVMDTEHSDVDFWGITETNGKVDDSFIVIRQNVFNNMERKFELSNFKYAVFCDTSFLEENNSFTTNLIKYAPLLLIEQFKSPFIAKEAFISNRLELLQYNHVDEICRTIDFVKKRYLYDVNMIFEDCIKTLNVVDVLNIFNLYYSIDPQGEYEFDVPNKTVLVVHLYYMDLLSKYSHYLENVPQNIDIIITTDSQEKANKIQNEYDKILNIHNFTEIRVVSSRGRDIATLVVDCIDLFKKYDYLGFVHDKKSSRDGQSITVGETFSYELWENMLASKKYILRVLNLLQQNNSLGLLVIPPPYFGPYLSVSNDYWTVCYEETEKLFSDNKIDVCMSREKQPISLGSVFWCKTKALSDISALKFTHNDFPPEPMKIDGTLGHALERSFPFFAQHQGYYTAYIATKTYAEASVMSFKELYYSKRRAFEIETEKNKKSIAEHLSIEKEMKNNISGLRENNLELQKHASELQNSILELKKLVQSMEQSTSWKVTQPLRYLNNHFIRLIRKE